MAAGRFTAPSEFGFSGVMVSQIGLAVPGDPGFEARIAAAAADGGDPNAAPYAAIVGFIYSAYDPDGKDFPLQLTMQASYAFALLGSLEGYAIRAADRLSVGALDQLQALRNESRDRWVAVQREIDKGNGL